MAIRNHYIPLTDDMRKELASLKDTTGCGAITLYNHMLRNQMTSDCSKLSVKKIDSWLSGICKSVNPKEYIAVVKAYKDILKGLDNKDHNSYGVAKSRIPITEEFQGKLKRLSNQSKNSGIAMLLRRSNAPKGLTTAVIGHAQSSRIKTIRKEHADHIEKLFALFNIE